MKRACLLSILGLLALRGLAAADDFAGTYMATLPQRAEILQLHRDGTASITLSDEVTAGAGGFTFSDSFAPGRSPGRGRSPRAS